MKQITLDHSFTPEVSSFDKEKGFWGCLQGFWLTVYCQRLAAELCRNMEKGNRSVLSAAAFLFQDETCNIPNTVNREKGAGLKLWSKLLHNYWLLFLKLLTGDPQIVGLSERNEIPASRRSNLNNLGEELERYCHSDGEKLWHIMWEVGILLGLCTSSHMKELLLPTYGCHSSENFLNSIISPFLTVTLRSVSPRNWHLNSATPWH